MHKRGGVVLAVILCSLPYAMAGASPPADPVSVDGVWVGHERFFSFMGMTTQYSCDGLEYKLRWLLKLAGAREDAVVHGSCTLSGPSRVSSARMFYYTLALPGSAAAEGADGKRAKRSRVEPPTPGVGAWKVVELGSSSNRADIQGGDCELVEQFDRELLSDFTTRNHESRFSCISPQISLAGIRSRFEVLAPLPKAADSTGSAD